ncbi:hypothetical protein ACFL6G_10320, partial [candidate division KSB1 bacterium]
ILARSKEGIEFTRDEIFAEIEDIKKYVKVNSGHIDEKLCNIEDQFDYILNGLKNNESPVWAPSQLAAISAQPNILYFLRDNLKDIKIDDLAQWEKLWQLQSVDYFSRVLLEIFQANIHNKQNRKYIVSVIDQQYSKLKNFYRHDYIIIDVVKTVQKILDLDDSFLEDIFLLVKKMFSDHDKQHFYIQNSQDNNYEVDNICSIINTIYNKSDEKLKLDIVRYILNEFNLIEENIDNHFSGFNYLYDIISNWFENDVQKNLFELTESFSNQYSKYYKQISRKIIFQGRELFGGVSVYWGRNYRVSDKRFVSGIITPAIEKFYNQDNNKAWEIIKNKCIIPDEKITKSKPDFLNRAVIPIVIKRYLHSDEKVSEEAFQIFYSFIMSKKGIPRKSDIIFQHIRNDKNIPLNKKWKLIDATLTIYDLPFNSFVEDIVTDLALNNYEKAKRAIIKWFESPEYLNKDRLFTRIYETLDSLIDKDLNLACELYIKYLSSKSFVNNDDIIDLGEDVKIFSKIIRNDFQKAKELWDDIAYNNMLTKQQQHFIMQCIADFDTNNITDDDKLLIRKIYKELLLPFLGNLNNDLRLIIKKLQYSNCRVEILRFAGFLARIQLIEEAINIVDIFQNDPSPYLPGKDPEDPINQYNEYYLISKGEEHLGIQSVRGWCCWVLTDCLQHGTILCRPHITEIIKLIELFSNDE